jgi:hypothetical protein
VGRPSPSASASVSASPSTTAKTHWLATSLSRVPAPASPSHIVRAPTASNTGATRSCCSSGPEASTISLPCSAGCLVPSTGASTSATPCSAASAAQRSVPSNPTVDICSHVIPPVSACPAHSRTASASVSIVSSRSAPAPASVGEPATNAPVSASGRAFSGVRFHTRTANPTAQRLRAIGAPMMPVPSTATVVSEAMVPRLPRAHGRETIGPIRCAARPGGGIGQTRWPQKPLAFGPCGFESRPGYSCWSHAAKRPISAGSAARTRATAACERSWHAHAVARERRERGRTPGRRRRCRRGRVHGNAAPSALRLRVEP